MPSTQSIQIQHQPSPHQLTQLGVDTWPIWTKEISEFPWTYGEAETCYLLEGEVIVTSDSGDAITIQAGDLVTFPAGLSCRWNILKAVKKHYRFD